MTLPSADDEVVVNLVTKGDIFGEIALLDGRTQAADGAGANAFLHLSYCCAPPVLMAALVSDYPKQNRQNYSNTVSVLRGSVTGTASPTALRVDPPAPAIAQ